MKKQVKWPKSDRKLWRPTLLELEDSLQGKPTKYWHRVEYPEPVAQAEVQSIRKRLKLTQLGLAAALGMSLSTVRSWEQGTKSPDGLARKVLRALEKDPKVLRLLTSV
jgi:DNA-binding transcriptional regulator YiaG